jgi:TetR/AcrR family transcriptional regulator, cholesterol catabolism regulator
MLNRKERQDKILLAAANLFLQKGYERTTIEDITDAVGINKAMLYYYFPDKQNVLFKIMNSSISEMITQSRKIERLKATTRKKLELLIQTHLMRFADQKSVPAVSHAELRNLSPRFRKKIIANRDKYEEIFRNVIREGINAGEFRSVDANLTAASILGLLNSVNLWYRNDGSYSMGDISARIIDMMFSGIAA